jgi:PhzF family phenazine biosynthesis protein
MKQYIVDAFTDKVFRGNPAAVCVMDSWISDELMQNITKENNLSETAFAVKENGDDYHLRWFTPGGEIDLCGHATLATAFVILNYYEPDRAEVSFETMSGRLTVVRRDDLYEMDFPAYHMKEVPVTVEMEAAIGSKPVAAYMGRDLLCVLEDEELVRNASPDMDKVTVLDGALLHITAAGKDYDCVSRSFAPKLKIVEDPVCGSGHCHIIPYWAKACGRDSLTAYQASARGGVLYCNVKGDRITLAGKAVLYSEADLKI